MPQEIHLWRIREEDDRLIEIPASPLDLEERLQEWLVRDISVLGRDLLVIGREVETDYGGYIDILCLDRDGDLVVVELKRDKTPREVTAQALDYASWVADLPSERISAIADKHLGPGRLEDAFAVRFGTDLPDTLNADHRILIVASRLDPSSERIVRYLSDTHGVNINVATFQCFRDHDGAQYLARVFLIEPSQAEFLSRTRGTSKRRPNLTYEELLALAEEAGVQDIYSHAVRRFERHLQKHTTRSSIAFTAIIDGSRKTVLGLMPGESSRERGLRFRIYSNRIRSLLGLSPDDPLSFLPEEREPWVYYENAGPDYEGFEGYFKNAEEVDRVAEVVSPTRSGGWGP